MVVEYEAEYIEYDSDDEEKIWTEISDTSWNQLRKIENKSLEKDSLLIEERSSMIEELQKLFEERQGLELKNIYLQKQILDFLIRSGKLNAMEKETIDCLSIHSDHRYKQVLDEYESFEIKLNSTSQENNHVVEQYKDLYESRVADFNLIFEEFKSKLSKIDLKIKSYDHEEPKDFVPILLNKLEKRLDVLKVNRIKYSKFEYTLKELEKLIKTQTRLPKEYSIREYENLKTIKSMRADKYEKNQTDLNSNLEKINSTIKVLGHVQQALDVVTNEVQMAEARLKQLHNIENEQRMKLIKIKKSCYSQQQKLNELQDLNTVLTWTSANKSFNNSFKIIKNVKQIEKK